MTGIAVDLSQPRAVHMVGIGGVGLSAMAEVLVAMGHRVSGSDGQDGPVLSRLRGLGVEAWAGHAPDLAREAEVVAFSTAVPPSDPDLVAAAAAGVPVRSRADLLAGICACRRTVAVSGTHGKTTTSAMVAAVLEGAGMEPSWIVGAELLASGSGGRWGTGDWLVVEADESDGTLLRLPAEVAVVTSVEPDHLDYWGTFAALTDGFSRFLDPARALGVVCADDLVAGRLAVAAGSRTYGTSEGARYRMVDLRAEGPSCRFTLEEGGRSLGEVAVGAPGAHNARNAAAAMAVGLSLGGSFEDCARGLARFGGVARRFQWRGERGGVTFVDDYAHLPTEVEGALAAAASGGWRRVVCVFQPHRYTRTETLGASFAGSFGAADVLVLTELYPAGEAPRPGVSAKLVLDAVAASAARPRRLLWMPERRRLVDWLARELRPGDLCLTLGAGDLTTLPDELAP